MVAAWCYQEIKIHTWIRSYCAVDNIIEVVGWYAVGCQFSHYHIERTKFRFKFEFKFKYYCCILGLLIVKPMETMVALKPNL